jgi:sigma-E factor negative regulatory protein RseC
MIEEHVVVVKTDNLQAWVAAEAKSACNGCQQKKSCSTNALNSVFKNKIVPVDSAIPLKAGDKVVVAIDESELLRASLLMYLLPLIAFFCGAGVAEWLTAGDPNSDAWVAGAAITSLLAALWLINKILGLCLWAYFARPVVVKKL